MSRSNKWVRNSVTLQTKTNQALVLITPKHKTLLVASTAKLSAPEVVLEPQSIIVTTPCEAVIASLDDSEHTSEHHKSSATSAHRDASEHPESSATSEHRNTSEYPESSATSEPRNPSEHPQSSATSAYCNPSEHPESSAPVRTEAGHEATGQTDARCRTNKLPRDFGSYTLVWEICRDALSTTYAANREGIEKLLAVRIFNVKLTDSALVRTIQRAAGKTSELTHHNHVTIYDHGVGDGGAPYVVTDWVEGESLAETFQLTKRLDIARFLNIFGQVCDALIEAHSRQLIHGNLSPHKIILATNDYECDSVKLIDFGMPPDPVQNALYLSPEQSLDRCKIDARSDIYSLGCIMYEALVGSPPFVGHKVSQAALNYLHELANQFSPDSPEHNALKLLDCIVIKCLQKTPSKRFRNVMELASALTLVNDCISGGSTKKLPPKADKLLLFRFLDFFDKKITFALMALFLFVGVQAKIITELQLQKAIDQAQLARMDEGGAVSDWQRAIDIANIANKPPGLKADLHWELAEEYKRQASDSLSPAQRVALSKSACAQYKAALEYYKHGRSYRSYSLCLLSNISDLVAVPSDPNTANVAREINIKEAKKLLAGKQYVQAVKKCEQYLESHPQSWELNKLAARACNEVALTMPPKKAIHYFERALAHALRCSMFVYIARHNLALCIEQLGYDPSIESTRQYLAIQALKDGDILAAQAELRSNGNILGVSSQVDTFLSTKESIAMELSLHNSTTGDELGALQQLLAMQDKCFGPHSKVQSITLNRLAQCYMSMGNKAAAISSYTRFFESVPHDNFITDDQLNMAQLLVASSRTPEARIFLERQLSMNDGEINFLNPLYIELLVAESKANRKDRVEALISQATGEAIPVPAKYYPYDSSGEFDSGGSSE